MKPLQPTVPTRRGTGFFGVQPLAVDQLFAAGRPTAFPRLRALGQPKAWPEPPAAPAAGFAPGSAAAPGVVTPEHRLLNRTTLGASLAEHARMSELGYAAYLAEQLDHRSLDDSALEAVLAENLPRIHWTPAQILAEDPEDFSSAAYDLLMATLYRWLYSPRQLFETVCVFWSDHFSIDIWSDWGNHFKPIDQQRVIRRYALGTFRNLLGASAHSPAMLAYLTNDSNYVGHPNENYARELMELHTLGVDNGYTQEDVREVARCFTGWAFSWDEDPTWGSFRFYPEAHDDGEKWVLGHRIPPGGGIADGEKVIDLLAAHPNTARFIARKLLIHFWGYEPPASYVNRVAQVYANTGGNIKAMLRTILKRPWMATATPKLKRPSHLLCSAIRALFAGAEDPWFLLDQTYTMGHLPFSWTPPNGYPDDRAYWSGFLLDRWNFPTALIDPDWSGVHFDDGYLAPHLTARALANRLDAVLFAGTATAATRAELQDFLRGPRDAYRVREALALAFASPEFQEF